MPEECLIEMKNTKTETTHGLLAATDSPSIDKVMNCEEFSSLHRLLTVMAHVIKFGQVLLKKVRGTAVGDVDYKDKAETLWIKASQRTLQSDKKFPQWKRQFDLFEDSAMLWRCRGRLQNVDASISTVHPILLNKNHHLTTLFIHKANNQLYIMVSKPHSLS